MKALVGHRCALEPQVAAHAAEMFVVLRDPAIYEFENVAPPSLQWLTERFERLESRGAADHSQQWLNWVVRVPSGRLAGYVQATVLPAGVAYVAYELGSEFWRQGIGSDAVSAMLDELTAQYGVRCFVAVLKAANDRSRGLLEKLGFSEARESVAAQYRDEHDEIVMVRQEGTATTSRESP